MLNPDAGGDWVWVYHPDRTYIPVRIVSVNKEAKTMKCRDEAGSSVVVPHQQVRKLRDVATTNATVPSTPHLPSITEAAVAYNIQRRYDKGQLFTCGKGIRRECRECRECRVVPCWFAAREPTGRNYK